MVAPLVIAAGVAAAASIVGGYLSNASQAKSEKEQRKMIQAARDEIAKIENPEQRALVLEELKKQGTYSPELEQGFTQANTELKNVNVDPTLVQAQKDALYQLSQIGKDGLTDQDEVNIERAKSGIVGQQSQANAQIQQDFSRRGVNSAGLELVARQQAGQDLNNRMANYQRDVQAEARNRALQALAQRGNLAASMRDQDFSEQAQRAKAQDAINQFNIANQQRVTGNNVDRNNQAQQSNLSENQRLADANVGIRNSASQYNSGADQRNFDNEMQKAAAMNGTLSPALNASANQATANANMWSGIIQGVNKGAATWATSQKKKEGEV